MRSQTSTRGLKAGRALWALTAGLSLAQGVPLQGQTLRYEGSLGYSAGTYLPPETTHTFTLSNGIALGLGRVELSAHLPLILLNSGIVDGLEGSSLAEIGDPVLQGALEVFQSINTLRAVTARFGTKVPLRGPESGLGTGAWDLGGGLSFVLGGGSTLFFGDIAYWRYGDLPDAELADGLSFLGGLSRSFLDYRGSLILTLTGAEPLIETMPPPLTAGIGLGYILSSGRMANIGVNLGLTDSSPDLSFSMGWSVGG